MTPFPPHQRRHAAPVRSSVQIICFFSRCPSGAGGAASAAASGCGTGVAATSEARSMRASFMVGRCRGSGSARLILGHGLGPGDLGPKQRSSTGAAACRLPAPLESYGIASYITTAHSVAPPGSTRALTVWSPSSAPSNYHMPGQQHFLPTRKKRLPPQYCLQLSGVRWAGLHTIRATKSASG